MVELDLSARVVVQEPMLVSGQLPKGLDKLGELLSLDLSGHR